ncbi:MAG: MFS transporter [Alphaproteobacteria bacterium]|nr:MFS transporter [Alphaproteobacteria bacterium]
MSSTETPAATSPGQTELTKGYVNYALGLLLVIYTLNFLDRQIVNILAEPIKQDLGLSDTQLGLLTGLAFAVVYTVLGIPIARYADRPTANRVTIIAIALSVWSAFTAVCGLAQNFLQLTLARIGVGVGEAGCTPPAHALISDKVPPEKRASALALYSMGVPLGSLLGLALGGMIADTLGWRWGFILVGLPGLLLAVITVTTLKEPRRFAAMQATIAAAKPSTSFTSALRELGRKKAYWNACFAAAVISFLGYGQIAFFGSFFVRVHGMPIGEIGLLLGLMIGISGVLGTFIGGQIADAAAKRDTRAYMTVPAVALILGAPFFIAAMLSDNAYLSIALLAIPTALNSLWYGPVYAAVQSIVPPRLRATAVAIMLFVVNMIGLGLGPLTMGMVSDYFATTLGYGAAEGLRWAILTTGSAGLIAMTFFLLARRTIREELEAAKHET